MKGSPLLGYNNNVRHKGRLYHIQTEDSGVKHPHIITHLFADGGRILSSKKTSYAEHVGSENCRQIVKKLMQDQHKSMFVALKSGEFEEGDARAATPASGEQSVDTDTSPSIDAPPATREDRGAVRVRDDKQLVDIDALERAAQRLSGPQTVAKDPPMYQATRAARRRESEPAPESIFGKDLLSEKSLDEVILSYLAEDLEDTD
jgi:hypothetical protein